MTSTVLPEGELLELLVQLQKTTPDSARAILNAQPAIGYALVPLMVRMGIVNLEVLQKTLSSYSASQMQVQAQAAPAVPPHVAQAQQYQQHPTPPPASQTPNPMYPPGTTSYAAYPPPSQNGAQQHPAYANQFAQPQPYAGHVPSQYAAQQQQRPVSAAPPAPAPAPGTSMLLGNIPDDQRDMIMHVISLTPEQINRLPPQDRAITIQLRATLGVPSE